MARAQFQKGQRVWVECVGVWAHIEKVLPVWAKGFEEPVRVTYDIGLGREFVAHELMLPVEDCASAELGNWRVLRARNRWQAAEEVLHHPLPGTHPVIVTDEIDWGGWRTPAAEYDRDPERIEFQARLIAAAPRLLALAQSLIEVVAENPEDTPAETLEIARRARRVLKTVTEVLSPPESALKPANGAEPPRTRPDAGSADQIRAA